MSEQSQPWTLEQVSTGGAKLGLFTGCVLAGFDLISQLLGEGGASRPASLAIAISALVVPVVTILGALTGAWLFVAWRLADHGTRVGLRAGLTSLPLILGAFWVPSSWLAENWASLRAPHKAVVVGVYAAIVVTFVCSMRFALSAYPRYKLSPARWRKARFVAMAAGALGFVACYGVDRTVFVGLYQDFHYGLAAASTLSLAIFLSVLQSETWDKKPAKRTLLWCGVALLLAFGLALLRPKIPEARHALIFQKVRNTLRNYTDFDGDGYSNLFGSQDCAPFDAQRSFGEVDFPGNGVDEDCSGADARRWPAAATATAYHVPDARGFNLLLITVDTLRADRLGSHGHSRKTSPTLDRLAKESLSFANAYSQSAKTADSVPSLLTGLYPANLPRDYMHPRLRGLKGSLYRLTEDATLLSERLKNRGYRTQAFVSFAVLHHLGLDRGFDRYEKTESITDKAKVFLQTAKGPFFLWLHYNEPHHPYLKHAGLDFGDSDLDRYDSEVAFIDAQVSAILQRLSEAGFAERTIVVFTSDHGEEFREHGGQFHGTTLYSSVLNVPLMLRIPGVEPKRVQELVELVDVVPTLCEALGISGDCAETDGQSLWRARAGQRDQGFGFRGAYAEMNMTGGILLKRSLLVDGLRLNVNIDEHSLQLFSLQADPGEKNDVAEASRDQLSTLQEQVSLRPYRRFASALSRASRGDCADLLKALPRIRNESVLRFALATLQQHPAPGFNAALARLRSRPQLSKRTADEIERLLAQATP